MERFGRHRVNRWRPSGERFRRENSIKRLRDLGSSLELFKGAFLKGRRRRGGDWPEICIPSRTMVSRATAGQRAYWAARPSSRAAIRVSVVPRQSHRRAKELMLSDWISSPTCSLVVGRPGFLRSHAKRWPVPVSIRCQGFSRGRRPLTPFGAGVLGAPNPFRVQKRLHRRI